MNDRISRVLKKMEEKGLTQLIVSDPLSIRFLTGIMVNPGERLYALILRTSGKHTMLLNYLYFVKDTGFEEVWFSDMEDQISIIADQIDPEQTLGIDMAGTFPDPASGETPTVEDRLGIRLCRWCSCRKK